MSKDKGPIPEYLDAMQPDAPNPDPPDTPTWRAVKKGAKWGSVAGLIAAQWLIGSNSVETPFGSIYTGNMFAVFAVCIGFGSGLGAGIGWLSIQQIGDEDDRPPRDFPREPYG